MHPTQMHQKLYPMFLVVLVLPESLALKQNRMQEMLIRREDASQNQVMILAHQNVLKETNIAKQVEMLDQIILTNLITDL